MILHIFCFNNKKLGVLTLQYQTLYLKQDNCHNLQTFKIHKEMVTEMQVHTNILHLYRVELTLYTP